MNREFGGRIRRLRPNDISPVNYVEHYVPNEVTVEAAHRNCAPGHSVGLPRQGPLHFAAPHHRPTNAPNIRLPIRLGVQTVGIAAFDLTESPIDRSRILPSLPQFNIERFNKASPRFEPTMLVDNRKLLTEVRNKAGDHVAGRNKGKW